MKRRQALKIITRARGGRRYPERTQRRAARCIVRWTRAVVRWRMRRMLAEAQAPRGISVKVAGVGPNDAGVIFLGAQQP